MKDNPTIFSDIESEILKEFDSEKVINGKILNEFKLKRTNLLHIIVRKMLGKLLFKLKIKITFYWGDSELLCYEIPKN